MALKKERIILILSILVVFFSMLNIIPILGISSPIIKSDTFLMAFVSETYIYQIKAIDGFGSELKYRLKKAPDGMSINVSTGLIEWIPNESQLGINEIKLEITNSKYQEILKLLDSLDTEDDIKMDSSITYEFSIEVLEKGIVKDCSEDTEINPDSIFKNLSGGS